MGVLRATITAAVMAVLVVLFGIPLLLLGLFKPWNVAADWSAFLWSKAILFCAGVRLRVHGAEHVVATEPRFYMGNHQSALDIPILIAALRGRVRFMAKDTLFQIPIFGWVIGRYGYAPIDRSNARRTLRSLEKLLTGLRREPISLAVFPEGTRSCDRSLLPFRRGTMKIAQRSGLSVVPFSIDGSIDVHHRDHFRARPGTVRLVFFPPIPAEQVASMSTTELRDKLVATIAGELGLPLEASLARQGSKVTVEST